MSKSIRSHRICQPNISTCIRLDVFPRSWTETSCSTRPEPLHYISMKLSPDRCCSQSEPRYRARMVQIISIIDSYGYVSMVRQVAGERVFAPLRKRQPDEALIRRGLEGSLRVLDALEAIVPDDGPVAGGEVWSLADFHLAPMMVYFTTAPEGAEALARYGKLSAWWCVMLERNSV